VGCNPGSRSGSADGRAKTECRTGAAHDLRRLAPGGRPGRRGARNRMNRMGSCWLESLREQPGKPARSVPNAPECHFGGLSDGLVHSVAETLSVSVLVPTIAPVPKSVRGSPRPRCADVGFLLLGAARSASALPSRRDAVSAGRSRCHTAGVGCIRYAHESVDRSACRTRERRADERGWQRPRFGTRGFGVRRG
jgi:hypothetical protein